MDRFKSISKYLIILVVLFIVLNINDSGGNDVTIDNVTGNFFSIMAKKIEEIMVSSLSFVFDLIKKIFNIFN